MCNRLVMTLSQTCFLTKYLQVKQFVQALNDMGLLCHDHPSKPVKPSAMIMEAFQCRCTRRTQKGTGAFGQPGKAFRVDGDSSLWCKKKSLEVGEFRICSRKPIAFFWPSVFILRHLSAEQPGSNSCAEPSKKLGSSRRS